MRWTRGGGVAGLPPRVLFEKGGDKLREGEKAKRGFTLIEVMLTMALFAITAIAFVTLFVSIGALNESSRNSSRAMADARIVLEQMRQVANANGLATVVANYPNNSNVAPLLGIVSLTNEVIRVNYANVAADPLSVALTVEWRERNRQRSAANGNAPVINTLLTRR